MSDINNKHIPEDLDSLTRKDMVELFKIQLEEHQGFIKEIESLREQLAKANERVKELDGKFESQMTNDFVTITDQAKRIAELESYNLKLANESHAYQRRCAELDEVADTAFKYNHSSAQCLRAWNKLQQLRKEQSND